MNAIDLTNPKTAAVALNLLFAEIDHEAAEKSWYGAFETRDEQGWWVGVGGEDYVDCALRWDADGVEGVYLEDAQGNVVAVGQEEVTAELLDMVSAWRKQCEI